ncbi:uncharacterized protein LAESUDRAFT_101777 [Laetiporus sulphureus 93-53]|uniref:Uncharacterized protein n=1 Tax=Laetiporus sulphureus 93-53 TaxID=1314785 RepID=A0A165ESW5_9APHY|nr:uncharacterized protein LAESUDRAFT_101777 [Laetiporus sulphureus 93-53]KZT07688.1 hypothetical protein LAESUDRAFT_101777 [Laetiporus sulphureus 93-53]
MFMRERRFEFHGDLPKTSVRTIRDQDDNLYFFWKEDFIGAHTFPCKMFHNVRRSPLFVYRSGLGGESELLQGLIVDRESCQSIRVRHDEVWCDSPTTGKPDADS